MMMGSKQAATDQGLSRDVLVNQLDELLLSARFRDYCPNGLQVEGAPDIHLLATACSASKAAIEAAVAAGAQALLVHHGILWNKAPLPVRGMLKGRLAPLLAADCSLIAYHLPLDAHPEHGNNAVLLQGLGYPQGQPFGDYMGQPIGLFADLPTAIDISTLSQRLAELVGHQVIHCPGNASSIRRIGVVTGGGQSLLIDAAAAGCDVLITGEASEQTWHEAQESGCHCLAAGHHATESMAVHRLGQQLAAQHGIQHLAIDLPNPI